MSSKKKSIFRQPGAKNFQLVHRSQRDPLIYDPDASEHVLKEFERKNTKGKPFNETTESAGKDEDVRVPGEAALYGIFFDDREYDYTQHLKPVGVEEKGVESILLEAPPRQKPKSNKNSIFELIPKEALPSEKEIPRTYESQQAIPSSIAGFQPDMDPHLRQTLEALEDEAFVDENLEDDFFGALLEEGERDEDEEIDFEFKEDGEDKGQGQVNSDEEDWQVRFRDFKKQQKLRTDQGSVVDSRSEGGDTLGRLPSLSVLGAKKRRRKGTSDASGYSMSSSSMFRNEGLTRLDEQFERFEEEYASDNDPEEPMTNSDSEDETAPPLITTREDFEAVLDEFLAQEQVGKKLSTKLEGDTPQDKLNTLRKALVDGMDEDERRIRKEALLNRVDKDDTPVPVPYDLDQKKERWDCETVLTTYSNLENHPRLLKLTQSKGTKKILLDSKTGLPTVVEKDKEAKVKSRHSSDTDESSEGEGEEEEGEVKSDGNGTSVKVTVTRSKNETAEEKRARKQAVKQERQERRKDKKNTKQMYSSERKQQNKAMSTREKPGVRSL